MKKLTLTIGTLLSINVSINAQTKFKGNGFEITMDMDSVTSFQRKNHAIRIETNDGSRIEFKEHITPQIIRPTIFPGTQDRGMPMQMWFDQQPGIQLTPGIHIQPSAVPMNSDTQTNSTHVIWFSK